MTPPTILIVGTLDTKGPEIDYLGRKVEQFGGGTVILDSGILGEPTPGVRVDITRRDVARAAGVTIDEVRASGSRGAAVEIMERGIKHLTEQLWGDGRIQGIVTLGGAEGALLGAAAMHTVPLGVPKLIVSPSASGRRSFAPFVGTKDVLVMHSVVDILGLNAISRSVFDNAAAAMVGMARDAGSAVVDVDGRSVAVTMLGQTTPGVMHMRDRLDASGIETVIFHANGVGGPAMEELIEAGAIAGVIEYSLSELANTLKDGLHSVDDTRLTVAGSHGLPQVVVPGCTDFFNQGAPQTLPEAYRDRKTYYHNPVATLVRLLPGEMAELGAIVASRLNDANGPVSVVFPTGGLSLSDAPGGALWDPDADTALLEALQRDLMGHVKLIVVEGNANDPAVAEVVAAEYLALTNENE